MWRGGLFELISNLSTIMEQSKKFIIYSLAFIKSISAKEEERKFLKKMK